MVPSVDDDIAHHIRILVRSGFFDQGEIEGIICDDELHGAQADKACADIAASIAALKREQETWPAETDCDRLDAVFLALNQNGIIALQNAGYTQNEGYDDTLAVYDEVADKGQVHGYCFYHGQDLERAVDGMGLYLSFGPIDPEHEATQGPGIGRTIVEELHRHGFSTQWDGTFEQRILVSPLDWKKRLP